MEVYLYRNGTGKKDSDLVTIGDMIANGTDVITLEDDYDEKKEYGKTRIPSGRYEIKLRSFGKHHERYKVRFHDIHKGMLWLQDVPNYTDILIHCGNTAEHTHGCILVGIDQLNEQAIKGSSIAYRKIYPIIANELVSGEKVWINIID